jgi:hypothetical protein
VVILDHLDIGSDEFSAGTGWDIKPAGACRGEVCVPLDNAGAFDVTSAADRLRMALVHDAESGLWALGPDTVNGRALASAVAPELVLPDVNGNEFRLSSLRGEKVVIVCWAPY